MIWGVLAAILAFGVGFYLGVWATVDVLATDASRSKMFADWIKQRQQKRRAEWLKENT